MTPTAARPISSQSAHWYTRAGEPMHTVIAKGSGQPRATTIADARKLDLVPSVTTILKVLNKPDLNNWIREQDCLAVLTSPHRENEELDAFVHRILHEDKTQDEERDAAAKFGLDFHGAIADSLEYKSVDPKWIPWILPVLDHLKVGATRHCEYRVVGNGYAGCVDLIVGDKEVDIYDFKTTKGRLPDKGSYVEHKLQLSAYAEALEANGFVVKSTSNVYISTVEPGKFIVHVNPTWHETYDNGFEPLLRYWQWANNFNNKP